MSASQTEMQKYIDNELKPNDTFKFECSMCGSCCRNRREPIVVTGADLFRIAKAQNIDAEEALWRYTRGYFGEESHVPVAVLAERDDGSCKLLRKGKCTVQSNKPAVCAIFPLGRFYDPVRGEFCYFTQSGCSKSKPDGREWTLEEWLAEFNIRESEPMAVAWNTLLTGIVQETRKMKKTEISERMFKVLLFVLYSNYDISRPYLEQVEENKALVAYYFRWKLRKELVFGARTINCSSPGSFNNGK